MRKIHGHDVNGHVDVDYCCFEFQRSQSKLRLLLGSFQIPVLVAFPVIEHRFHATLDTGTSFEILEWFREEACNIQVD